MDIAELELAVENAVSASVVGAAILDGEGKPLAIAGALDADEARAVAAHATRDGAAPQRLLAGEQRTILLGDRKAVVGIAARSVFYVVVCDVAADHGAVERLRSELERLIQNARAARGMIASGGSGGSSSGPAELPVIELGITVRKPS